MKYGWLLLLVGCATHTPQLSFPSLPTAEPPTTEVPGPTLDACPAAVPLIPGQPPPYVTDNKATCRAQVVPEHQVFELLADQTLMVYWKDRADICHRYRQLERDFVSREFVSLAESSVTLSRQNQVLRFALPLAVIGGIALGSATTIAVVNLTP